MDPLAVLAYAAEQAPPFIGMEWMEWWYSRRHSDVIQCLPVYSAC